jgi:hypothetical protein
MKLRLLLSLIPVAIATPLLLLVSTADAVPMVFGTTLSGRTRCRLTVRPGLARPWWCWTRPLKRSG